ncbi:hypothetical protein [Streptomyces klenkii]
MADKTRLEGMVRIEEIGPGRSRVIGEICIEARGFGAGGPFESVFEKLRRHAGRAGDPWQRPARC